MKACELMWRNLGVLHAVIAEADDGLAAVGLDARQMHLLGLLDRHPNPAALARAMVVPPPTVTFLVKRAEAAGHLQRKTVPTDLRKYQLLLTPAGRSAMERGREVMDRAFGKRLAALSAAERAAFERAVLKLDPPAAPPLPRTTRPAK